MDQIDDVGRYIRQQKNNEKAELRQFYSSILHHLLGIPISRIPEAIKKDIAVTLRAHSLRESDWKEHIFVMGVQNDRQISEIEAEAECQRKMPMMLALNQVIADKSIAELIYALDQLERFEILKDLRPYITEVIEKIVHNAEVKALPMIHCFKPNLPSDKEVQPSDPVQENPDEEEKISLFIQHTNTESDIDYAKQLCKKLKEAEFKVKTMCEIDAILAFNKRKALPVIFKEVDFIVPVVSENLLKQIYAEDFNKFKDPADASINHYFYDLIQKEYYDNACENYRVRPVIVPGMDRRKLGGDVILSYSHRFGAEDEKLVRVLKDTKQLIPQYCLQPNRQ